MPARTHIPVRRSRFRFLTIAVILGNLLPAMAEETGVDPVAELPAVRVSAIRSTIDVEDSPRAISVIEKEQIENRPGTSGIQPLLAEVPGISFSRTGGLGGAIMMRGMSSATRHSALAIDGDRMRGRSVLDYNLIDPNSIERIEVIRGPASALWGSDAMNGIVNIVTRRAPASLDESFSMKAQIRALDYNSGNNMYGGRAELIGSGGGFDVLVGAYAREADDYRTPEGRALNSDFRTRGTDFRLGFSPTQETRFELAGRYQQVTTGRAGGMGAAPGVPYMVVREDPIQEQYLKLFHGKRDFLFVAYCLVIVRVQQYAAAGADFLCQGAAPAQQRLHPFEQQLDFKWLDHIIVRFVVEGLDLIAVVGQR